MRIGAPEDSGNDDLAAAIPDPPYCYGWIYDVATAEDPAQIDVAQTRWYIEFDGRSVSPSYPNCWAKGAAGWPYPLDTQWYGEYCEPGGSDSGEGFDLYALTTYFNWDWGNDYQRTNVLLQPGLQYNWSYFNPYIHFYRDGEDASLIHLETTESISDYFCWYAPQARNGPGRPVVRRK